MSKTKLFIATALIVAIASLNTFSAPVDEATALTAASRFLQTSRIAAHSLPWRTAESIRARGSLWVVALSPSGHILVSGSDHATPIIGFSENDFAEGEENSPERAMLDAADAAVAAAEADESKERHECWKNLLAESAPSTRKAVKVLLANSGNEAKSGSGLYIEPFVDSKYNQNQPWNDLTPITSKDEDYIWRGRSCAGCVSIADAAIFRELRWPVYPARTETVTHNLRGENFAIRFNGSAPFDWDKMYDTYTYSGDMRGRTGAEEDKRYEIGRYVLWLNQSAAMSYNVGESTSTKYTSAHGCERDWYTIGYSSGSVTNEQGVVRSEVVDKVTETLAAGIPVFVGVPGHATVADGWQDDTTNTFVHIVYGYGGNASDRYYNIVSDTVRYFWLDHYPRAKPQLDPIPRVVGDSVTLSWHFPDCYTAADKLYWFNITGKRRGSNNVVEWTADFSNAATGNAYPANIWYATNTFGAGSVALDAEDLTYGFYQFSTPLTVTTNSVLSFKIRGGADKSGDACKDNLVIEICGEDGNWHELLVPEINWAYWPGSWKENETNLVEYAGQTVQLRIYKRHATYNGHVAIGDFKVTNVIPLDGESIYKMALASDRSATIEGLEAGADYYFSVTPYTYGLPVPSEPSDAKITTCRAGASSEMPEFTSIQYAANGGASADLVDGYLADGAIGSSTLYVTTPTTVTNLTATPSHLTLVSNDTVHVSHLADGRWKVTFDPVIPANRDRQRMILTLHATDTNGTTIHRDVVMRMTEDKIVVGEGETWTLNESYELTRSLVMAGGTLTANATLAINQNSISSFAVTSNSTINGAGELCISNSNATITFESSASLTNGLNIESANQETLTLAGTGTFVQGAGTTIKVYSLELGEHVLLNLNLTVGQSTANAIVQFGESVAAISGWKLKIDAPADLPKGTYPLVFASSYLEKPTTIYLPNLDRECNVVVKNYNMLCLEVGDPKTEQSTNTDYPVPYSWIATYVPGIPESYMEQFAKMSAANGENKYWECYVLGLDPTNAASVFVATLTMDGTTPVIAFSPTNETLTASATMPISYVLQGNASSEGGEWVDTSFAAPGANYVRFRIDVRWTNGEVKHIYSNEVNVPVEPVYEGPAPIAEWNKDFWRTVEGCSLDCHGNTVGADGIITINTSAGNEYQGVDVNLASGTNAITVIVKYSDLSYSTANGRMVFTSCAESSKTTDRTAVRLTTGNALSGSWGDNSGVAERDTSKFPGSSVPTSSGYMVFCYGNPTDDNNRGTLICSGDAEGNLNVTNFWQNGLRFAADSNNKTIYGATIGGYRKYSTSNSWKNATGMKIEAIAVFGARLTEAERNAYRFPDPVERVTETDYPVPYSWFDGYGIAVADVEATAAGVSTNGVNKWWECYVLGLDPTNALSRFVATIRMEGETPVVEYTPTNETLKASGEISYILQGRPTLTNDWSDCPSFAEPGDTNRFFRVKVSWDASGF